MKLYKYLSWRPFTSKCEYNQDCVLIPRCYSQENILNSQLYYNSAKAFNDPFDLSPFFDPAVTQAQLLEKVIVAVRDGEGFTGKRAVSRAKELIRKGNLSTHNGRQTALEGLLSTLYAQGICCFSATGPENVLLWSHYAEKHTGICLEFNLTTPCKLQLLKTSAIPQTLLTPQPIRYDANLPKPNIFRNTDSELTIALLTKSPEWDYENEYRSMSLNYIGLVKYPPWELSAIFSGCKMLEKEFDELKSTIRRMKYQPRLFKTMKKKDTFGFDFDQIFP